ncbi:ROK family transcriptional regulator [Heyndrickxia acidicola]|uniref:ROK family transcriptional regulator n=1 Tax=Heyndrickxia acidicola TaxID=209389 RepID=A0ABU6MF97_9BACI|nr:ROK family transcriptional regulator [Heyndrickxia acidicola]MED1203062.1 ROK family transcriptional regulator [Heyndrickxia acidicola]
MAIGDAAYIKKINRSQIVQTIFKEEMISRADLSDITKLTKATISAQVASLLEDGLIVESQQEHNFVGRKPIMLSINDKAGFALGIDLDYGHISFALSDLKGQLVSTDTIETDTKNYSSVIQLLTDYIKKYELQSSESRYGLVGIVIAIHGLVNKDETIHFIPRLNWYDVDLKKDLQKSICVPIYIENNANVCSFAERVFVHHETDNLVSVTLYSGIGVGIMMNNTLFHGQNGFAGEAGHMIIVPNGIACSCGNKGCWEKYASESSIFQKLSQKMNKDNLTYKHIQKWIDEGDSNVQQLMEETIYYLSIGLNNLINIYNPEIVVLDSELLRMYPQSLLKIRENLTSSVSHYRDMVISTLGKKSSVLGACALAIKQFFDVPILNLSYSEEMSLK